MTDLRNNKSAVELAQEELQAAAAKLAKAVEADKQAAVELGIIEPESDVTVRVRNDGDVTGHVALQKEHAKPEQERLDRVKRSTLAAIDQAYAKKG